MVKIIINDDTEIRGILDYENDTVINLIDVDVYRKSGKVHWNSYGINKCMIKERIDL